MVSKVLRYISAPLVGLCAMPVLWASTADATFVSCKAGRSKAFPYYGQQEQFSTECQYQLDPTQTDVAGQARILMGQFGGIGVESNLTWATNATNPHAYAFGYIHGQNGPVQVTGCMTDDTIADGVWKTKTCSVGPVLINIVVNGS